MDQTKLNKADLDSPRRELSLRGLGFVVAFSVFGEINFRVRLLGVQSSCSNECFGGYWLMVQCLPCFFALI